MGNGCRFHVPSCLLERLGHFDGSVHGAVCLFATARWSWVWWSQHPEAQILLPYGVLRLPIRQLRTGELFISVSGEKVAQNLSMLFSWSELGEKTQWMMFFLFATCMCQCALSSDCTLWGGCEFFFHGALAAGDLFAMLYLGQYCLRCQVLAPHHPAPQYPPRALFAAARACELPRFFRHSWIQHPTCLNPLVHILVLKNLVGDIVAG